MSSAACLDTSNRKCTYRTISTTFEFLNFLQIIMINDLIGMIVM